MRPLVKQSLLIFLVLTLASCEKKIDWPVMGDGNSQLVVYGMITSELKTQEIVINHTITGPNDEPEAYSGAQVIVSTTDSVYSFAEDSLNPGHYYSQKEFAGIAGKEYSLFINANGNIISGKATMLPVSDFTFLQLGQAETSDMMKITWVAEPYNSTEPAMYEIQLDWSAVEGFEGKPNDSTSARLLYYTLPTIDVSQLFAPVMEKITFPIGTTIIEKKYSLTNEHAAFIRAMLAETNLQGGLFNSVPANAPVTLSNSTLGHFSACEVLEKRATVK